MKTIEIFYWHGQKYENLPYNPFESFKYSKRKLHEIVDLVLSRGYGLKIHDYSDRIVIQIDQGNFKQR